MRSPITRSRIAFAASATLLALLSATPGTAQTSQSAATEGDSGRTWSFGVASLRAGITRFGIGELNSHLAQSGRPTFSDASPTVGFGAYARVGRILLGASAEGSVGNRLVENGWMTRLSAGSATLDAGYALVETATTVVYPILSLGVQQLGLRFERRGDFPYDSALADPARSVTLSSRGGLVALGLGAERRMRMKSLGQFSLMTQFGVDMPFGAAATSAGESKVSDTPPQSPGMSFRIGFGKPLGHREEALGAVTAALLSMLSR